MASQDTATTEIVFHERYTERLAHRAMALATVPRRRDVVLQWAFSIIITAGMIYLSYQVLSGHATLDWTVRRVLVLVLGLYFVLGPVLRRRRAGAAMWRHLQSSSPLTGYIDDEGISYDTGTAEVPYPWTEIARVYDDSQSQLLVLLTKEDMMLGLAGPFFDNDDDWERSRQMVRLKTGKL